jgi:hypothetical protein
MVNCGIFVVSCSSPPGGAASLDEIGDTASRVNTFVAGDAEKLLTRDVLANISRLTQSRRPRRDAPATEDGELEAMKIKCTGVDVTFFAYREGEGLVSMAPHEVDDISAIDTYDALATVEIEGEDYTLLFQQPTNGDVPALAIDVERCDGSRLAETYDPDGLGFHAVFEGFDEVRAQVGAAVNDAIEEAEEAVAAADGEDEEEDED